MALGKVGLHADTELWMPHAPALPVWLQVIPTPSLSLSFFIGKVEDGQLVLSDTQVPTFRGPRRLLPVLSVKFPRLRMSLSSW